MYTYASTKHMPSMKNLTVAHSRSVFSVFFNSSMEKMSQIFAFGSRLLHSIELVMYVIKKYH